VPTQQPVDYHLTCHGCGYDLYGLAVDSDCPECGTPFLLILCDIAERAKAMPLIPFGDQALSRLGNVAARTSHTLDAVVFLYRSYRFAVEARRRPLEALGVGDGNIDGRHLCLAVRDFARAEFGASAPQWLASWGLTTREGVGKLLGDMVRHGAMRLGSGESADSFITADCPDPVVPIA
jgi:uncharacterized repeat protein (TIGR04138 family)